MLKPPTDCRKNYLHCKNFLTLVFFSFYVTWLYSGVLASYLQSCAYYLKIKVKHYHGCKKRGASEEARAETKDQHHSERKIWSLPASVSPHPDYLFQIHKDFWTSTRYSGIFWFMVGIHVKWLTICSYDCAEVAAYQFTRTNTRLLVGVQSLIL